MTQHDWPAMIIGVTLKTPPLDSASTRAASLKKRAAMAWSMGKKTCTSTSPWTWPNQCDDARCRCLATASTATASSSKAAMVSSSVPSISLAINSPSAAAIVNVLSR